MNTIVHVIDSLAIGGAEKLLKSTLDSLAGYRHIVCYLHPPVDLLNSLNCSKVYCLYANDYKNSFSAAVRLRTIISRHKPFAVHSHLLLSTWIARLATWKKCPLFFSVHSVLSQDAFLINKKSLVVEKLTYKKGQTIIAVSDEVLRDYHKWVGIKGSSFTLPNFVPDKFFLREHLQREGDPTIRLVAVGNLKALKNYDRLLDAMKLLKGYPIALDIYGDGPLRTHLSERIKVEQLDVSLRGTTTDMEDVLPNYDLFIMPSFHEGFGLAAMEAMAIGLPVLLSDLNVFREVAGSFPIFFDQTNPSSIASAIRGVIQNIEAARLTALSAKQAILLTASEHTYMKRLDEIYKTAFSSSLS